MLTSTPSTGTDLNASADPTFFLSSAQQTHRLFCRTVYSWQTRNRFLASQNKQLVVIKTEREARGEKRVTGMSEKKKKRNCLDIMKEGKKTPRLSQVLL